MPQPWAPGGFALTWRAFGSHTGCFFGATSKSVEIMKVESSFKFQACVSEGVSWATFHYLSPAVRPSGPAGSWAGLTESISVHSWAASSLSALPEPSLGAGHGHTAPPRAPTELHCTRAQGQGTWGQSRAEAWCGGEWGSDQFPSCSLETETPWGS